MVDFGLYLEDHPGLNKWLITMVSCCPLSGAFLVDTWPATPLAMSPVSLLNMRRMCESPLSGVVGPLPNGRFMAYK